MNMLQAITSHHQAFFMVFSTENSTASQKYKKATGRIYVLLSSVLD